MMKRIAINIFKIVLSSVITLAILSIFCLAYNYTGCHITNKDASTDYKWESNQYFSTMKEGFSWFRFDRNGFNNENDDSFNNNPVDILVMGSSHMEAVQIKPYENVAALLNEFLPEYRTYNIGISGHSIYTCMQNLPVAVEQYNPQKYIVLETSTVKLSDSSMKQVLEDSYPEIPSHDSGLMYTIQKSIPATKSLYKSVTEWVSISLWNSNSEVSETEKNDEVQQSGSSEYIEILDAFLNKAASSVPSDCKMIIFYHPSTRIDENGNFIINDRTEVELFSQICKNNGIIFLDETDNFVNLYDTEHILAHGFSNTAIGVGHLNKYGHHVIANSLVDLILKQEEQ